MDPTATFGSPGVLNFAWGTLARALHPASDGVTPAGVITQFDLSSAPHGSQGITTGPDGNLWFTELDSRKIGRIALSAGCLADSQSVCLDEHRFRTQVSWNATTLGTSGLGSAVPLTPNTAAFWFFTPNNIEVVVKVVDGRAVNGNFWVFVGALSDVEYEVTVTDTLTGAVQTYSNPQGTLRSIADTSAFLETSLHSAER